MTILEGILGSDLEMSSRTSVEGFFENFNEFQNH